MICNAFATTGKGNCVHPKQLYTIEGLKNALKSSEMKN